MVCLCEETYLATCRTRKQRCHSNNIYEHIILSALKQGNSISSVKGALRAESNREGSLGSMGPVQNIILNPLHLGHSEVICRAALLTGKSRQFGVL